jgi:hypothetical protein
MECPLDVRVSIQTPTKNKEKKAHLVRCTPITQQKLEDVFMHRVKLEGAGVFTGRRAL